MPIIIALIYRELSKVCNLQFYQIESLAIKKANRRFVHELDDNFPEILAILGIKACHSAAGRLSNARTQRRIPGLSHQLRKDEKVLSLL